MTASLQELALLYATEEFLGEDPRDVWSVIEWHAKSVLNLMEDLLRGESTLHHRQNFLQMVADALHPDHEADYEFAATSNTEIWLSQCGTAGDIRRRRLEWMVGESCSRDAARVEEIQESERGNFTHLYKKAPLPPHKQLGGPRGPEPGLTLIGAGLGYGAGAGDKKKY